MHLDPHVSPQAFPQITPHNDLEDCGLDTGTVLVMRCVFRGS